MNGSRILDGKKTRIWFAVGVLLFLTFTLQACSSPGATRDMPARATWTPVAHPTDLPYQVEGEAPSYFGETPALVIFGSQNPEDKSPLQAINLSTEDDYDVAALTPGPLSTWSRPIMSADKELFLQIGPQLYQLLPGGSVTALDLPFDGEDPVFCNWSWQGQVVCLNALMTEGYLVDRDLNLVEMSLPAYAPANDSVAFYPPYRVGENAIRIVQTKTGRAGNQMVIYYRELNLDTQSVSNQQFNIDFNFNRVVEIDEVSNDSDVYMFTQSDEPPIVQGVTDDGSIAYIQSTLKYASDEGGESSLYWMEMYDQQADGPVHLELPLNFRYPEKNFYQNHLITNWFYFERENRMVLWPGVYDLETGELLFDSIRVFDNERTFTEILPYGENWLVGCFYGLGFVNDEGHFMKTFYFPDEVVADYPNDGLYVVTQPMEP